MISTSEAARRLGVSQRRVVAIISDQPSIARRWGRLWVIDPDALETMRKTRENSQKVRSYRRRVGR
jgi:excisionase family DNA binding protein